MKTRSSDAVVVRLPGAPPEVPALPADLIQPIVDESHVAYYQATPQPFFFLHSSHLPAGNVTPAHKHPCIAVHGCLHGPLRLIAGGKNHLLDAGDFFVLAPELVHSWQSPGPHPAANISLLIDQRHPGSWPSGSGVKECLTELTRAVTGLHRFRAAADPVLQHVFWVLADHVMAERPRRPAATTGLLLTWMGRLVELLGSARPKTGDQADVAEQIRRLLLARIGDSLSIEEVANEVCLSPTQAKRVFRATFGCGIMTYYNQMKVWQAKRLLTTTALTIEQIAGKLGFASASYFGRAFLRITGQTPREFRKRARGS